ncbi:hypothetical protein Leryth_005187, partial [Lithospermum erythrorhizon]
MDAADKCISIEFIFFEQDSSCLLDLPESINNFFKQIGDLENCSFRSYLPDAQIYLRLVKQWFQELKEDIEEPLQARFVFRINLIDTLKQISCNLCPSSNHLIDLLVPSQVCIVAYMYTLDTTYLFTEKKLKFSSTFNNSQFQLYKLK